MRDQANTFEKMPASLALFLIFEMLKNFKLDAQSTSNIDAKKS